MPIDPGWLVRRYRGVDTWCLVSWINSQIGFIWPLKVSVFCETDYLAYIELITDWCHACNVAIGDWFPRSNYVHLIGVPSITGSLAHAIGEARTSGIPGASILANNGKASLAGTVCLFFHE